MTKGERLFQLVIQALGGGMALTLVWLCSEFSVMYEYDVRERWYLRMAAPHLALVAGLALTLLLSVAAARLLRCRWLSALGRTGKAFASGMLMSFTMLAIMIFLWFVTIGLVETLMW